MYEKDMEIPLENRKVQQGEEVISNITQLLGEWEGGKRESLEKVINLVYRELRKKAEYYLNMESDNHSLQPTALISEAVLQMMNSGKNGFKNRAMFFGFMGHLMRHVLVKYARNRQAAKRGGGKYPEPLDEGMAHLGRDLNLPEILSLHDALTQLEMVDPRKSRIVELRFFAGLNIRETALAMDLSQTTIKSEWHVARRWLALRLDQQRYRNSQN